MKAVDATSEAKRTATFEWFTSALITRLDNKLTDGIIVVGQRLHLDDLSGQLLASGAKWHEIKLPAIAQEDERIPIGFDRYHNRKTGDILHPAREPLHKLDELRKDVGADNFEAQYQQNPVPPGGAMIKRDWVQRYSVLPARDDNSTVMLSFDTASKDGAHNDWSVCTVWQQQGREKIYLVDVVRQRLLYPSLKALARRLALKYDPDMILIEEAGVGIGLIEELKEEGHFAYGMTPERDKISRMAVQSIAFENGRVFLPKQAAWLADYEAELFSFPGSRYDDQVDSTSQALARFRHRGYDSSLNWVG